MSLIVKRYTASWCSPCRQLAPVMNEIASEMPGVIFRTIDVDEYSAEAKKDRVNSVPTVIIEQNGEELHRFVGVRPKHVISNVINEYRK